VNFRIILTVHFFGFLIVVTKSQLIRNSENIQKAINFKNIEPGGLMNYSKLLLQVTITFLSLVNAVKASQVTVTEEALFTTYSGEFKSDIIKHEQAFSIYLPDSYKHSERQYPVVYVLDGDFLFSTAVNISKIRASRGLMPESIVIGFSTISNRFNVATPIKRSKDATNVMFENGDPSAFLKFLSQEFNPYIEQKYRVANFKTIIGMSPTAGLVFYDYFQEDPQFDAHVAISAEIQLYTVDGESLVDRIARRSKGNKSTFLHLSRGESDFENNPDLPAVFENMANKLKNSDKAKVEIIEDGEHYGSSLSAINRAFLHIFPTEVDFINIRKKEGFVNKLKSIYQALTNEYGFKFYPIDDGYWLGNSIAGTNRYLLRMKKSAESVELLSWASANEPNNIRHRYNLTWAYEINGQQEDAIKSAKKLVKLAEQQQHKSLVLFKDYLLELQEQKK